MSHSNSKAALEQAVREEVNGFLHDLTNGVIAPTQVLIVYANANGEFGFNANEGNVLIQVGMLEAVKSVLAGQVVAQTTQTEELDCAPGKVSVKATSLDS